MVCGLVGVIQNMIDIQGFGLYIFVFVGTVALVGLGTVRCLFMANGKTILSSVIAFVEVFLWLTVTSTVVTNVTENPWKLVAYCMGGAVGTRMGQLINRRFESSRVFIECESSIESAREAVLALNREKIRSTLTNCYDTRKEERGLLYVEIPMKRCDEVIHIIRTAAPDSALFFGVP